MFYTSLRRLEQTAIAMQYSGLPRLPSNLLPKDSANPYSDYDAEKLKAFLAAYELPRDPGASFEYSNLADDGLYGQATGQAAFPIFHRPLMNSSLRSPASASVLPAVRREQ